MIRKLAFVTFTGLGALVALPAVADTIVREVDVSVDMDALQNANAAAHWSGLADDLENAIVAALVGRTGEQGAKISVDIDEVELASTFQSAVGVADSRLSGDVGITHDSDNTKFDNYELTVTFEQAGPFFLPGTDLAAITTDSQEYYDAMIATFADHVVNKLD
ncbi:hypothetical protein DEA8626_02553 [Defluviimonas aquaemixtae]|uniref:Uncharacterized protein n=1 Tax=Albidovulum aquaemixtae TaxID=1542388 RepID=A0A2R8BJA6_9RHOB|nr:hypothetical protein [Defluviimonas aquaemixtae]SPH23490.1 hypothetical protein DEA8626_02553 [Defluviimonas aquaemixtae]